ncbi:MAG: ATP-binding cassette domain-containing protein [Acidobacteria bacterium]|nr:MAG: ATP-binding cassette domain-containing protein [Acidobacteriota bacterium]
MPLISLDDVSIAFSHVPLLDHAGLLLDTGERVAIIGRNGTGKSTLLQILSGELPPDSGSIWRQPGVTSARLVQDVPLTSEATVFDVVAEGLGNLQALVTAYHKAAIRVADDHSEAALDALGRAQSALDKVGGWTLEERIELVLQKLDLDADARINSLSGGWRRRVLLARALVAEPSILLLDEPTNHLDVEAIEWLEAFLVEYKGAIVFVTHDREFLQNVATRIVELDRGALTSWPGDYETFLEKKAAWLANERVANEKFDSLMAKEEVWLRRGVKARRTRDEGRVKKLMAMRETRAERRDVIGQVEMEVGVAARSGQMVFELTDVSKSYGDRTVISHLTTRIMRGDRIGLVGPNGSGKTTLLRLLMGEIEPDPGSGTVRRGANVEIAYYDQQREQLDPEATVLEAVADGNSTVTINGEVRHVHGYLEDFLFPPERARSPVKALSGGERNRLLLARLFTRPANVLVFDEPTNDLDIETLELLERLFVEFPGTILLVSHDRAFLSAVTTRTIALQEFQGSRVPEFQGSSVPKSRASEEPARAQRKLSYKEQREFDALPEKIATLEAEEKALETRVSDPAFYQSGKAAITETLERVEAIKQELLVAYARWAELDERA